MVNNAWKTVTLSSIGTFQKGSGISRAESNSGALPAVRYGELYTVHNNYVRKYTSHISHEVASKALRVHCGDILFACSGETKEDIAKCAAIIDDSEVYAGGDIIVLSPTTKVDPIFLGFVLNTQDVIQQRAQKAQGDAIVHISTDSIKSIEIAMPEYSEQVKIAKALYDIDTLIVNLEKLIAKKKAIKQGAMQELLTGRRRLPGFDGEWNTYRFGDIFAILPNNAFTRAEMSDSGVVKNIHYGDILTKYHEYISAESNEIPYIAPSVDLSRFSDKCFVKSGDIIIADTAEDETVGKALEVIMVSGLMLSGQHTMLCRPQIPFAERFLGYYLNATCYHEQLIPYITGTKVSSISKTSIAQTFLCVPGLQEQAAIADILTDMDSEIAKLEENLAKYCLVKQGMMSELLTGRIRLL